MTEKRFTLAYEKGNWWAVRDRDITLWKEEVVGLLNELYHKSLKENEQLKKALVELKEIGDYQYGRIKELSNENEQLKKEIKEYKEFIDEVWRKYETAHGLSIENSNWWNND